MCVAVVHGDPDANDNYCSGQQSGNQQAEDSNLGPVKLEQIDEKTDCPGGTGVQWFPTQMATLNAGGKYTLTFSVTTCGNAYQRKNAAWIDFNGNNVFDNWEKIGEADVGATAGANLVNFPFTVPSLTSTTNTSAANTMWVTGTQFTRMRVVVVENGFDPMDPCLQFPYGGMKDFPITLGTGGGLDIGGILLIVVFVGGLAGLGVTVVVCWKLKQINPKEFMMERVLAPTKTFCGLAKSGCLFVAHKMKCVKKGETGDYDEL